MVLISTIYYSGCFFYVRYLYTRPYSRKDVIHLEQSPLLTLMAISLSLLPVRISPLCPVLPQTISQLLSHRLLMRRKYKIHT